jgi:potassium-transporting ATPase potassium-binding subunit
MAWTEYAVAMLLFSGVSMLLLYLIQRVQGYLPFNPQKLGAVSPPNLAFNTAASFTTNTNWQAYVGRNHDELLHPDGGLAYHNFISAATGIALAIAFIRGIARREMKTIGNFWVDLVRCSPVGAAAVLRGGRAGAGVAGSGAEPEAVRHGEDRGAAAGAAPGRDGKPAVGADGKPVMDTVTDQTIAQGPVASQEFIKEFGTNGGGFFNANSAHPFENPTPLTNLIEMLCIFALGAGLTYTLGRMTGSQRHGWAVWGAMAALFLAGVTVLLGGGAGQSAAARRGSARERDADRRQHGRQGGALRHRQLRALCHGHHGHQLRRGQQLHDSFTPLGGMIPLINISLGEVIFGGVGSGLYGMVVFVILTVFIAGPDGRANAGVSGQEDRGLRGEDGDAVRAHLSR